MTRKEFLELTGAFALSAGCTTAAPVRGKMLFGACRSISDAPLLADCGFDFWECGVAATLKPEATGEDWAKQRKAILAAPIPLRSCNGFLPGTFRLTGPKAAFDAPLAYAVKACRHADEVGLKTIVFGSSGARKLPEGFDRAQGFAQFTDFCKRLADRIADCQVTVVLEPLNPREDNLLHFVSEGMEIVKRVDSPRLQQLADLYHMVEGGESPDSIRAAGAAIRHCHVAEPGKRTAPGMNGGDLSAYFAALRDIGYAGGMSCECGWPKDKKDLPAQLRKTLAILKGWAGQA